MVSQKSGAAKQRAQQEFHVRIVHIDYYMRKPVPGLDAAYSQLQGTAIDRVPIVRIFGSTPSGQKTCVHIRRVCVDFAQTQCNLLHLRERVLTVSECCQAFPYFYVPYGEDLPLEVSEGADC